ncbi:MAG: hypothetical protein AB7K24_14620 [Gemmataceae bacterium]
MRSRGMYGLLALLLYVGCLAAIEVEAVVNKIDVEKRALQVTARGKERTVQVDKDAKFLDEKGKPLPDGLESKEIKPGIKVTLTVERGGNGPVVKALQLGGTAASGVPDKSGKTSVGFKPLTEMTADDRYKGEDGGLFGGGKNEPPAAHRQAADKEAARIVPLDENGKPAKEGKMALISISMSNATQEFSYFKRIADRDEGKAPRLTIVDCAQGGQAMAEWTDPAARPWEEAERRLKAAGISPNQVQIAWIKLANKQPRGELKEHGKKLQDDTLKVIQNAKAKFPNLRLAYLDSRTYGGYAVGNLNPEPYAYEGAYPVRWLIQNQIKGVPELNYDPSKGAVKAPLLLWGAYFWGDGTTPRKSDGLVWERDDFAKDGVHPTESGRRKVAEMLLKFFKSDPTAKAWFGKK